MVSLSYYVNKRCTGAFCNIFWLDNKVFNSFFNGSYNFPHSLLIIKNSINIYGFDSFYWNFNKVIQKTFL